MQQEKPHRTPGTSSVGVRTTGAGLALVLPPRKKGIGVGDLVLTREGLALTLPDWGRVSDIDQGRTGTDVPTQEKGELGRGSGVD